MPADTDVLMVLDPESLDAKARFAIDQFLMRGGAVVLATSPYKVGLTGTLSVSPQRSGLAGLARGLRGDDRQTVWCSIPQNASLPVPVERKVGGLSLREIHMMPYPHFPDIRAEGLSRQSPVTATLNQLTLNWASPITLADKMPVGLQAVTAGDKLAAKLDLDRART